jgi:thymidylate synthase (FAD)
MATKYRLSNGSFPSVVPEVYKTENGVSYLTSPGVTVLEVPSVNLLGMKGFLDGFPTELKFVEYLSDPVYLEPAEILCKVAGQLCYLSFGPGRSENKDAGVYFRNILESSHGSVLEHANFSMLWWGISRSLTHELVRHRAGFGFSQVSQRYVGGKTLRFVERPEYQIDSLLHGLFLRRIERSYVEYEELSDYLMERQKGGEKILSAEKKTDLRKKVRQAARSVLPNETEAPIMVTANVRAWRHFFNMRVSEHAEVEIRRVGFEAFRCLSVLAPLLFDDFETVHLADGTHGLKTAYPKV